jgi:hypothetical protein
MKERPMRRYADRLAVLLAATLVMGCTPETSTPSPEPAGTDVSPHPTPKGGIGLALKKKKKQPGLGSAPPKASIDSRSTR